MIKKKKSIIFNLWNMQQQQEKKKIFFSFWTKKNPVTFPHFCMYESEQN